MIKGGSSHSKEIKMVFLSWITLVVGLHRFLIHSLFHNSVKGLIVLSGWLLMLLVLNDYILSSF